MGKVRNFTAFNPESAFCDDGFFTFSSTEQKRVEDLVGEEFKAFMAAASGGGADGAAQCTPVLHRVAHTHYVCRCLKELGKSYSTLDASRPWFCYWGMHSLRLLEVSVDDSLTSSIIRFLKTCEAETGGYGGGPGQIAHLATTYGAVMALISIGTVNALNSINRKTLKKFLREMKQSDGSFTLHAGGEADIRGAYCALAVGSITNILDQELIEGTDCWLISCQTYEGGFGGERGCEAHGGYTLCGVASLAILGKCNLMHTPSLFKWLAQKQMKFEGGFQGRTNKLVDGCYSFWQAAVFPILELELIRENITVNGLFDATALQEFVLVACQDKEGGGLRDKPDKAKDMYHTCYTLSGLSIAQSYTPDAIVGGPENKLPQVSPVYNILSSCEKFASDFFAAKENDL